MIRIAAALLVTALALPLLVPAAEAQPRTASATACPAVPALVLRPDFRDPRRRFAEGSPAFRGTVQNFRTAWRRACARGLLRRAAWPSLLLRNAPDANVASIYRDPDARSRLTLEYPFVTADGAARVPPVEELAEAIHCHVRGATPQEQEESGRCLPD